ncbi:HDOD domain-containing protein [Corallincola platygyrae]|uniref:HDOD domain-containing protein n=1 Tax=Corallincola platygyrae TaxID=1193278 RepID=A0ABW4XM34_9GAMM
MAERHIDFLSGIRFHTPAELMDLEVQHQQQMKGLAVEIERRRKAAKQSAQKEMLKATLQQRLTAQTEQKLLESINEDWRATHRKFPINPRLSEALQLLEGGAPENHLAMQLRQSSWLAKELLSTVNSPAFRATSGHREAVTDLSHALASLGRERLHGTLAQFLCEQLKLTEDAAYAQTGRRCWQYAVVKANTVALIAQAEGLDVEVARRLAWNDSYGLLALIYLIESVLSPLRNHHLHQARVGGKTSIHQLLSDITPPPTLTKRLLLAQQETLSKRLLGDIAPACKYSHTVMNERWSSLPLRLTSPYCRILLRANAYAQYFSLNEQRRILPQEAVKLMQQLGFSGEDLQELDRQNLKKQRK